MKNIFNKTIFAILCFLFVKGQVYATSEAWQNHYATLFNGQSVSFKCEYIVNDLENLYKIVIKGDSSGIHIIQQNNSIVTLEYAYVNNEGKYAPVSIKTGNYSVSYGDKINFDNLMLFLHENNVCYNTLYLHSISSVPELLHLFDTRKDDTNNEWHVLRLNNSNNANELIIDGQNMYGYNSESSTPIGPGGSNETEEKDDTIININKTLDEIKKEGVLDSDLIYGNVLRCQLFGQQSESDHILEILGKTKVIFSDDKTISFCLQKYRMSKKDYVAQDKTAINIFIYNEFSKLASKSVCPAGYSISSTFKTPLYIEPDNGNNVDLYYGMYCAYSDNDSSTAAYEKLLDDMKQYIYVYDTWQYSKCYNAQCSSYINESKIDKYNHDFKMYQELIIANEDETYDFSVGEQYLTRINNMSCANESNSDCSSMSVEKIYNPTPTKSSCSSLFGNPDDKQDPAYYMSFAFKIIRYLAIVLLIVLSVMDLISAVASHEDEQLKKAVNKLITRFIYCVVIFLLPELITFILKYLNERAIDLCINTEM